MIKTIKTMVIAIFIILVIAISPIGTLLLEILN